jgi:hypothetical protein
LKKIKPIFLTSLQKSFLCFLGIDITKIVALLAAFILRIKAASKRIKQFFAIFPKRIKFFILY